MTGQWKIKTLDDAGNERTSAVALSQSETVLRLRQVVERTRGAQTVRAYDPNGAIVAQYVARHLR